VHLFSSEVDVQLSQQRFGGLVFGFLFFAIFANRFYPIIHPVEMLIS